jgi:hypothetical protein
MVEFLKVKNNASSTLNGAVTASATTIVVTSASSFPTTGNFHVTIWDIDNYTDPGLDPNMEIVKVTSVSGNTFTVVRGQESTTGVEHSDGDNIQLLMTAGVIEDIEEQIEGLTSDDIADGSTYVQTTNDYTDAEKSKLAGIESGATGDQTGAEIKSLYEAESDTNAFTDSEKSKLNGIESGAEANNISDINATDLTDGGATTLHKHSYNNLDDLPTIPDELSDLSDDSTHRLVTDTEKSTWNAKQDALVADTDYLMPGTASSTYEPLKGADDNYVTDAEKIVIGNTSGTNSGDQDLSGYQTNTYRGCIY